MHRGTSREAMRRIVATLTLSAAGALCGSGVVTAAPFPDLGRAYIVYMSRATDACTVPTESVLGPVNLPALACPQQHAVTDATLPFGFARLLLQEGRVIVLGNGFPASSSVGIELQLRASREAVPTTMGTQRVTFPDFAVSCPPLPTKADGLLFALLDLDACLGAYPALATGVTNLEILGVRFTNPANGNAVFGTTGIVRGGTANPSAPVKFPQQSRTKNLDVWLARAMDPCTSPSLGVTAPALPPTACPAANTVTDDTVGMSHGHLRITRSGTIRLKGRGFTIGDALRVRLTLRVTRQDVTTTGGPGQAVTFSDLTVDCPPAPDAFLVKINGSVSGRTELGACLGTPLSGLALGNVELVDVSVVNALTGQPVATPGLVIN